MDLFGLIAAAHLFLKLKSEDYSRVSIEHINYGKDIYNVMYKSHMPAYVNCSVKLL